jgi:hypothetical protein
MSMQERAAVVIANSIRMKRPQYPTRTFLLVEGQDDKAFFGRYTDSDSCSITVAHGRPKVVEVILELDRSGFQGALGIVDADFEVLERRTPPSPNILVTDHHDVECMMLASPALKHLLRELGAEELISSFQAEKGSELVSHLLSIGKVVGYLRWASARHQWKLKFEGLSFKAFVREKDFSFELRQLLEEVRKHQGGRAGPVPSVLDLEASIEEIKDPAHDAWHVCCGHDLVELLSIGLRRVLGKNNEGDVRVERLEQLLRLAYEEGYFSRTTLFVSIQAWERRNPPFKVLPVAAA